MFNNVKKEFFCTLLLINIFVSFVFSHTNNIKFKKIEELEKYLDTKINNSTQNLKEKKESIQNIKQLAKKISQSISINKKQIIGMLVTLEKLFEEISNFNKKKCSLKKIKETNKRIKKQINDIIKTNKYKNNPNSIDQIRNLIEKIDLIISQNQNNKSLIKKVINTAILGIITGVSITGIAFYKTNKAPQKEFHDFLYKLTEKIKNTIHKSNGVNSLETGKYNNSITHPSSNISEIESSGTEELHSSDTEVPGHFETSEPTLKTKQPKSNKISNTSNKIRNKPSTNQTEPNSRTTDVQQTPPEGHGWTTLNPIEELKKKSLTERYLPPFLKRYLPPFLSSC